MVKVFAALLLACGSLPFTDPGTEMVRIIAPCPQGSEKFPQGSPGPSMRCWVTMLGESGAKYQHPFGINDALDCEAVYYCGRRGELFFVLDSAGATQVAGVIWDDSLPRPERGPGAL